jgi:nuclease HARBI1
MSVSDFFGVSVASGSRIIKEVSRVIASLRPDFISMPCREEQQETALHFYNIARFPACIGAIDCTHVKILSPGKHI